MGDLGLVLYCLEQSVLKTMCHSPESQVYTGFDTGLIQALLQQVICFHSQSGVVTCFQFQSGAALHCFYVVLMMAQR